MNIFLFNKSLRCYDNTTLIFQTINETNITPIFIFTEQVNKKKNDYFSNNSVQFMVESLKDLSEEITKKYKGKLYFFHSDNLISVFNEILKNTKINSIGTNQDYSPYARQRQDILIDFCNKNNIKYYSKEDHLLYDILDGKTLKKDGNPYTVFTPFRNFCQKNLKVNKVNNFINFQFSKNSDMKKNKYYISETEIYKFYEDNPDINIHGGRQNGLEILKKANKFKDYIQKRDLCTYQTTYLSAHNHFGTISIREVYDVFKKNSGIINELHWRDFYYGLFYYFPYMLEGQIDRVNHAFKKKFDKINWNNNQDLFDKWCNGKLGIPICDAGMRQLNKTGYMHNRVRMITASVVTKLLLIDWKIAEKYFAQKLVDYDCIQNGGGWHWTCNGIDPNQIFRIFSPKIQSKKYDPDTEYIKKYIPELENVPPNDIHEWDIKYIKYNISYPKPQIDYTKSRKIGLNEFKRINKTKN
jgi:deoxyribodipyrimidine photo-lyase